MVNVKVDYTDGTSSEADYPSDLIQRYDALVSSGKAGKALVWELLSDDWAAPPKYVALLGTRADGSEFKARIFCL